MLFTHLLVPTDFSEAARRALQYALEEATLHYARATLLRLLPPDSRAIVVLRDFDEEALSRVCEFTLGRFYGTREAETAGHAADTIVRIAQGRNADVIVTVPTAAPGLSQDVPCSSGSTRKKPSSGRRS